MAGTRAYNYEKAPVEVGSYGGELYNFARIMREFHGHRTTVLDFGAGTGIYSTWMQEELNISVTALDPSPGSLKYARVDKKVQRNLADANLNNHSFHGVHLKDVLEHCSDLNELFGLLTQTLRTDGLIMCTFRDVNREEEQLMVRSREDIPYYELSAGKVANAGLQHNIVFGDQRTWRAENLQEEWYSLPVPRTILIGRYTP